MGSDGDNLIAASGDNDTINGLGGNDTFVFNNGWGEDTISDFTDGEDLIQFNTQDVASINDLTITSSGSDTILTFDAQTITLTGVNSSIIDENDFIF